MSKKLISSPLLLTSLFACSYDFPPANDLRIVGGIKQTETGSIGKQYFVTVCNYSEERKPELIAEYEVIFRFNNTILNPTPRLDRLQRDKCLDSEVVTLLTGQKGKLTAYADWRTVEGYPVDNYAQIEISE